MVKNLPVNKGDVSFTLGQEDLPEKEMVAHSSILAWEIPQTEEPRGRESIGSSQRIEHNLAIKQKQKALGLGREGPLEVAGCAAGIQQWGGGAGEAWSRVELCCQGGWLEPQPFSPSAFPEGPARWGLVPVLSQWPREGQVGPPPRRSVSLHVTRLHRSCREGRWGLGDRGR